MDLSTTYLGLELSHPVVAGAGPLTRHLDSVKRLEDAGAAAIVMPSLFEEQLEAEQMGAIHHLDRHGESFAEAGSYLPNLDVFATGTEEYVQELARMKEALDIPVIASLNGSSARGWLEYGRLLEEAGADALELNVYYLSTNAVETAMEVEARLVAMVLELRDHLRVPLAVKLSPFFTALPNVAKQLASVGANGLVLFNRFYQPDLDPETLDVVRSLRLSDPSELLLRLRWLAILSGRTPLSLACSGGVHHPIDVVKAVMAGASSVQTVSGLLRLGPGQIGVLRDGFREWLEEHEYESTRQALGSLDQRRCPDPSAYERANYIEILQSWGEVETLGG